MTNEWSGSRVTVFPVPEEVERNRRDFRVEVSAGGGDWIEVPVLAAKVAYRTDFQGYNRFWTSFASADIAGTVQVRVTSLSRNIDFLRIRPASEGIVWAADRTTVTFSVFRPCRLSLEVNGDRYRNLQLYFNPEEEQIPDPADGKVLFLGPGLHDQASCPAVTVTDKGAPVVYVEEGQTLYLAGGAVLRATVVVRGDHTRVMGRGIIDLLFSNSPDCDAHSLPEGHIYPQGITLDHCSDVEISGLIVRNPCHYVVCGNQCSHVTIDNLKCFAAHSWSDGIDMMSSSHITIRNCFIRSVDDCIAVYARRWNNVGDSRDWDVSHSILWTDDAHTINIGTHGTQDPAHRETIADLRFRDLDILEVNCNQPLYWGAMALTVGDENICRNILFEDIRVYDFAESNLLYVKVQKNGEYNPAPGFRIEGVTFRNIDYRGANQNPSCIAGYGPDRVVKDVTFENLCINGEKALSPEQANLEIGPYAENVTFR